MGMAQGGEGRTHSNSCCHRKAVTLTSRYRPGQVLAGDIGLTYGYASRGQYIPAVANHHCMAAVQPDIRLVGWKSRLAEKNGRMHWLGRGQLLARERTLEQ